MASSKVSRSTKTYAPRSRSPGRASRVVQLRLSQSDSSRATSSAAKRALAGPTGADEHEDAWLAGVWFSAQSL